MTDKFSLSIQLPNPHCSSGFKISTAPTGAQKERSWCTKLLYWCSS